MKKTLRRLPFFVAAVFVLAQIALTEERHSARNLTALRDEARAEHHALLDANRNLRLEKQTLFNPMSLAREAERLQMTEPSLADGTLVFLPGAGG